MTTPNKSRTAPLQNMRLCHEALLTSKNRDQRLPGLVTFTGPSGLGKSWAAAFATSKENACYIELRSTWSKKYMVQQLCLELGISDQGTIPDLVHRVAETLQLSQRPLIVDEADFLIAEHGKAKADIEVIRDIFEMSRVPILMIGEELFPEKLSRYERFDNRIIAHIKAQPCSFNEAKELATYYSPKVTLDDELVEYIWKECRQVTRRICGNFSNVSEFGKRTSKEHLTLSDWFTGSQQLFTGAAPKRKAIHA